MIDLVTGGCGFIGAHLVHRLVADGRRVRVIDDLSTGVRARLHDLGDMVEVITMDMATADLTDSFAGVGRVFHLAAVPSVPRSIAAPTQSHASIATATLRALEAARVGSVTAFVNSSSSSVYGDAEGTEKHEALPLRPISPYGVAKAAAEMYCAVYGRIHGLSVISLRYFNVFGPGQGFDSAYAAVIPRFIKAAIDGTPITVYGDGSQTRDFTYVDNVVEANLAAADAAQRYRGNSYNVALGAPRSVNDLIAEIEKLVARPLERVHVPDRPGDILHSAARTSAAARDLGWSPTIGFVEGLRRSFEWYRANPAPR